MVQGAGPENDGPRVQDRVVQGAGPEGDSTKVQKTVLEADRVEGNGGGDWAGPEASRDNNDVQPTAWKVTGQDVDVQAGLFR